MNTVPTALTVRDVDFREKIVPIYQCISPEGLLDESGRGKLAEEITGLGQAADLQAVQKSVPRDSPRCVRTTCVMLGSCRR
jgi:hypothetical protein